MVSIKDIARITGFSVTTVSRALNDHYDVSAKTKALIQKVADEQGYAPNISAQTLVSKKSKTFGFITSGFSPVSMMDSFSFKLFMYCVNRANELGYDIILIHYKASIYKSKSFNQIISERNLDGAIIQGFDENDNFCTDAKNSQVPTVFVDIEAQNESTAFVLSDIKKAVELGFEYLFSNNHRRICFIRGSLESWITKKWLIEVEAFFEKESRSFEQLDMISGEYNSDVAEQAVIDYYNSRREKKATALFSSSDVMAIGAMKGVRQLGYEVPADISILGYDNITLTEYITPAISTISQDLEAIGERAVDSLLEIIQGNEVATGIIDVQLIKRNSVVKNNG